MTFFGQMLKNLPLHSVLETLKNMLTVQLTTPQYNCLQLTLLITPVNNLL